MNKLDLFFINAIGILTLLGPPTFVLAGWLRCFKEEVQPTPQWRRLLRTSALVGATAEFVGFWVVYLSAPLFHRNDVWAFYAIWEKWSRISFYSCVFIILIAVLGKGKGRVFAILSCVSVIFGLIGIDATR